MNKTLLSAGIVASTLAYAAPSLALIVRDANYLGQIMGEKICSVVWSNESTTLTRKGVLKEVVESMPTAQQSDFVVIMQLSERYGKEHPINQAYIKGLSEILLNNCWEEYNNLPDLK